MSKFVPTAAEDRIYSRRRIREGEGVTDMPNDDPLSGEVTEDAAELDDELDIEEIDDELDIEEIVDEVDEADEVEEAAGEESSVETEVVSTADEALEELEAEELELLEEEVAETLLVDEAAELRAIRRAELTLDTDAQEIRGDEFVCSSCFLVKRISQLGDKRRLICKDCLG